MLFANSLLCCINFLFSTRKLVILPFPLTFYASFAPAIHVFILNLNYHRRVKAVACTCSRKAPVAPTTGGLCCPLTRHPLSPLRGCTENKGLSFSPGPSSLISLIVQTVLPLREQPQVGKERFLPLLLGDLCLARDYVSAAEFKCLILCGWCVSGFFRGLQFSGSLGYNVFLPTCKLGPHSMASCCEGPLPMAALWRQV